VSCTSIRRPGTDITYVGVRANKEPGSYQLLHAPVVNGCFLTEELSDLGTPPPLQSYVSHMLLISSYMYVRMQTRTYTYTHARTTRTRVRACVYICGHTLTHAHTCVRARTHIRMHTHTRAHTHTHTAFDADACRIALVLNQADSTAWPTKPHNRLLCLCSF